MKNSLAIMSPTNEQLTVDDLKRKLMDGAPLDLKGDSLPYCIATPPSNSADEVAV